MPRPLTIENRWDVLYRDYPEVYEAFGACPYLPDPVDVVATRFELHGTVVDIGSGTGRSTLRLAAHAARVVGVEPEAAMRQVAERRAQEEGVDNVAFLAATKESIPLPDASVDAVVSVFGGVDPPEAVRIARPGAPIVVVGIPPGRYGGELVDVIAQPTPELEDDHRVLVEAGFAFEDFESVQEYGSTDRIVETYGFIFGRRAVEHLRRTCQTSIRWTFRLHHRSA
jgi:SAM-dependent methyltransferase